MSGVSSNYSPKYAERTFENMSRLKEGNAVFTLPNTPIKCAGAPLKACYLTEDFIRNVCIRIFYIDLFFIPWYLIKKREKFSIYV